MYLSNFIEEKRVKLYVQLMIIFTISLIGEGISALFIYIQETIIGLLILFLCLQLKWLRIAMNLVGSFLLANMTIFVFTSSSWDYG